MSFEDRLSAHRRRRQMRVSTAVLIIGGSSYFSMLVGVLRSILVMRLIGPNAQGIRRIVDVITKYLFNAHLGILHGTNKAVPLYLGQGDQEKVQEVEDVGISWTIGLTFVAAVGMAIWGLWYPHIGRTTSIAVVIGAGWLLAQQTYTIYRTILRAWGNFGALGLIGGIDTLATFAFTLLGAWKFGVLGAMGGTLAAWLLSLLALHLLAPLHIRPNFSLRGAGELIRAGFPIALVIFADTLLRTVDAAIISPNPNYGTYRFGLYSMAMQMAAYLYAIPEAAGFVIWPKILQAYGAAAGQDAALRRQIVLPTLVSGIFMPILAGAAYVSLPPIVAAILPQFASAIPAAQALAMASVFLALPLATNSLLIANNREATVVMVKLIGAGVSAMGCLWLVRQNAPLEHLAIAASAGYAVSGLLSILIVLPRYERCLVRLAKLFAATLAPFLWACGALAVSHALAAVFVEPSTTSWVWTVLRLVAFVFLMAPVVVYGNRHTHLLQELRDMHRSWRHKSELTSGESDETND